MFRNRLLSAFCLHVLVAAFFFPQAARSGMITTTDTLPPFQGTYAGSGVEGLFDFLASFGVIIEIVGPAHSLPAPMTLCGDPPGSVACSTPTVVGEMEIETFKSDISFVGRVVGGPSEPFFGSNIEVVTQVTLVSILGDTRLFDNELLQLTIDGMLLGIPFTLREDPDRASTGQTSITDLGGGLFRIDSFFDVFTELSLDGSPFVDCDPCGRVELVAIPEPVSVALLGMGLGLLAMARIVSRSGLPSASS